MADNKLLGAGGLYYGGNEISKAYMGNNLVWEKEEINPFITEYFTIQSLVDNNTITFTKYSKNSNYIITDKPIKYSKDLNTWTNISFVTGSTSKIVLNSGEKLYLKGNNSAYGEKIQDKNSQSSNANILSSGNIDVMGNIMSLVYGDDFINNNIIEPLAFIYLFYNNNKLVNAKDLILPATALASNCYWSMFEGCTGLVSSPELPATTLADHCYCGMFSGCTGLVSAPELPATTLAASCYQSMFSGCTGLTSAPELPATTLAESCCWSMFERCTGLTSAPELPATALVKYCYYCMFMNCSSLTTAPELPATTLVSSCYTLMFNGCTSLNYIKAMFTTAPSGWTYTGSWVQNVSSTGTFVKNSEATWDVSGANGIPSGWTVHTASS